VVGETEFEMLGDTDGEIEAEMVGELVLGLEIGSQTRRAPMWVTVPKFEP
jgi:hypothetical protein